MSAFIHGLVSSEGRISRSVYGWSVVALILFNETINPIFAAAVRGKEKLQGEIVDKVGEGLQITSPEDMLDPDKQADLVGAAATTVAADTGLNSLLGLLLLGLLFVLLRTFYVLAKKRVCDIGLPVAFVLVPVGLFFLKQVFLDGAPDYMWWAANIVFMLSFLGLAFVPGSAGTNQYGEPPEAVWPETRLTSGQSSLAKTQPAIKVKPGGAPRAQFGQRK